MTAALRPVLAADAVLSTDGNPSYRVVAAKLGIEAGRFVAGYDGPGGDGVLHVQNVNAYDSRLKGWMVRFRGVATQYLHHYPGWRRLLDRTKPLRRSRWTRPLESPALSIRGHRHAPALLISCLLT
jgi:hypothetical protein